MCDRKMLQSVFLVNFAVCVSQDVDGEFTMIHGSVVPELDLTLCGTHMIDAGVVPFLSC